MLSAGMLLALLLACASPAPEGPPHLRIGFAPIADCAHLYVATEEGLWAKHGLEVEETELGAGPKILEALAAGSIDVAFTGIVPLLQARSHGLPFVVVGGAIVEDPEHTAHRLLARAGATIGGVGDLAGKSVAVATRQGMDELVLDEALAKAGIAKDAVQLREVPFARMEGVLRSGEIDAAVAMEPYVSAAAKDGSAQVIGDPYTDVAARTLVSTWVMKSDAAKGEAGRAVGATFAEAAAWIAEHDAETRAIVAKRTGLDPTTVASMPMNRMEAAPRKEDIEAMIDRASKVGLVPAPPKADELLLP